MPIKALRLFVFGVHHGCIDGNLGPFRKLFDLRAGTKAGVSGKMGRGPTTRAVQCALAWLPAAASCVRSPPGLAPRNQE